MLQSIKKILPPKTKLHRTETWNRRKKWSKEAKEELTAQEMYLRFRAAPEDSRPTELSGVQLRTRVRKSKSGLTGTNSRRIH